MSGEKKEVSFSIEEEKLGKLEALSEAFGRELESILNEALDQYIELNEWKIAHINKEAKKKEEKPASAEDSESIFDKFTGASKS